MLRPLYSAAEETVLEGEEMYMVVGFEVAPCSITRAPGKAVENIVCDADTSSKAPAQEVKAGADIVYTYDVYWQVRTANITGAVFV